MRQRYEVWRPARVQKIIDSELKGQGAGFAKTLRELEHNPCGLGAYRLVGTLKPKVCGYHLRHGWRLALSFLHPDPEGHDGTVVILYLGKKDLSKAKSLGPMWQVVHDLFGEEAGIGSLERQPCCEDEKGAADKPRVSEDEVLVTMERLKRLQKRARSRRRR